MPRPISWLPRLHEIRRAVSGSVRSHYDRRDLQALFEVQPRAAQKLLGMLPTVQVGTSRLVEREALGKFLDGVHGVEDVPGFLEQLRKRASGVSRRKIRSLVRADIAPVTLDSVPECMSLSRGRLEVSFRSVEQLAEAMLALARILETEGEEFARAYEPDLSSPEGDDSTEMLELFQDLSDIEVEINSRAP